MLTYYLKARRTKTTQEMFLRVNNAIMQYLQHAINVFKSNVTDSVNTENVITDDQ